MSLLFKKYNVPGPRYTSYPTVPYWEAPPTETQWVQSILESLTSSQKQGIGASIYVHIPFCESLCTYCGCNTRITRNHGVSEPYKDSVLKEWNLYRQKLSLTQTPLLLSELHLGGGTPTFFNPEELKRLLEPLLNSCKISSHHEFSIEADPRVTSYEQLKTLQSLGFKRLSLGIQDFDPKVQDIVHRVQSVEQVQKLTEGARELGFTSINYDLIYGLPLQTLQSLEKTFDSVIRLKPDRIAFYSYAHVPWIKASQRRFTEADLPSGENKRELYERGRAWLEAQGYIEIGMDHFALKRDSLWKAQQTKTLHRNFMGYTSQHVSPQIGLGVSAIGDSWNAFMQNEKILETYQKRIETGELPIFRGHILTAEDKILRQHLLNLMTRFETSWKDPKQQTDFLLTVGERLREFEIDRLIEIKNQTCKVLPLGKPFLRNICMAFDARLIRKAPQTHLFSQTI